MSTIAYKDGFIAADSRVTSNMTILSDDFCKLHVLTKPKSSIGNCIVGGVGSPELIQKFMDSKLKDHSLLKADDEDGDIVSELMILKENCVELHSHLGYAVYPLDKPLAIGSGAEVAMAFMLAGETAVNAIRMASTVDLCTNNVVRQAKIGSKAAVVVK